MKIPLSKPFWGREEEKAVINAIRNTIGTGDGPNSSEMVKKLQNLTGAKYVLPVTSCTHGLELAMAGLGIKRGDEVIVPSFTLSATANAVVLRGATPVFADIDPITYNIDPEDIKRCITRKTSGIIVVHYAGMPCDMEKIKSLAKKHKLFVAEDAAHAIGAFDQKTALGNMVDVGVFSFHGTKNISCGEGGAVLTNDKKLAHRMEIYRVNGTNKNAFIRGEVDRYSWVMEGSSYFLSDILAALINTQLTKLKQINFERQKIAFYYSKNLQKYTKLIQLPVIPKGAKPNWHIYAIRFFKPDQAESFIQLMNARGIGVTSHYVPLHTSKMGKIINNISRKLPVTDMVAKTLVRFPIYPGLTKRELVYIVKSAKEVLRSIIY